MILDLKELDEKQPIKTNFCECGKGQPSTTMQTTKTIMYYLLELELMNRENSFFNTTAESGQLLMNYESIAKGQETDIVSVFNPGDKLTPYEVEFRLSRSNKTMLIGSVKRGLTNMVTKGLLTKNSEMKLGAYGRKNYTWSLK